MRRRPITRLSVLLASVTLVATLLPATAATAATAGSEPAPDGSRSLCAPEPGAVACLAEEAPVRPTVTPARLGAYGPADLKLAYSIPDSTTTATVAVVTAFAAPTVEADLATYRAAYGLPPCGTADGCLTVLNQRGAPAPLPGRVDSGWEGETALDVQMVSAVCPTCRILLVLADSSSGQDMYAAVLTAADRGARAVGMSWGAAEFAGMQRFTFDRPGTAFVAASGDDGYATSWPAADPRVVSVGGTTLQRDASTVRGFTETVWGDARGGTGSGCSAFFAAPVWQDPATCGGKRAMNDVAIVADPATGVAVHLRGAWRKMGGTSAGAPMIAAMYALAGGPAGSAPAPSYPYARRGDFLDVTRGANGTCGTVLCTAAQGWDGPTGVGVPVGVGGFRAPMRFTDYPASEPFGPQVYALANRGVINGWSDGTFRPAQSVTREAFASFLAGVINSHRPGTVGAGTCVGGHGSGAFRDVDRTSPFCQQIAGLAAAGIVRGWDDGTFRAGEPITREAMAAMVHRADAVVAGRIVASSAGCTGAAPFTDVTDANVFCADITWMKDAGISTGYTDGSYQPNGLTMRDATAAFLARLLDRWQ